MPNQSATINVMIQAARKAAKSLLKDFAEVENLQASTKSPGDFVSKADLRAEKIIRYELEKARPYYGWVGEESEEVIGKDPTRRWIVDPLDGTSTFFMEYHIGQFQFCLLYTSPSPRDKRQYRMPSSA